VFKSIIVVFGLHISPRTDSMFIIFHGSLCIWQRLQ